ncbi:MAG: BrnA antitoxin family protein [Proteobacteria bacterium]|nr:BrnA antitoxin family protein [Pseudomonadota bacterium]
MRDEYDFSQAKRATDVPHLAKLQAEMAGKTRITMRVDNETLSAFKAHAQAKGGSYQTLMNAALGDYLKGQTLADVVRETIREELSHT